MTVPHPLHPAPHRRHPVLGYERDRTALAVQYLIGGLLVMTKPRADPVCALRMTTTALLTLLNNVRPEELTEEDRAKLHDCTRALNALLRLARSC